MTGKAKSEKPSSVFSERDLRLLRRQIRMYISRYRRKLRVSPTADPRAHHPSFFCADCDVDTCLNHQYYMLKNRIWKLIAPKDSEVMLCLSCAERRLGRQLTREDFGRALVNKTQAPLCPELAERLARKG